MFRTKSPSPSPAAAAAAAAAKPQQQQRDLDLIVFGATLVITLLQRYPLLVWAGAGLLGWVAGSIMVSDPGWHSLLGAWPHLVDEVVGGSVGVVFVLALAWALRKRAAAAHGVNEEQKPAQ